MMATQTSDVRVPSCYLSPTIRVLIHCWLVAAAPEGRRAHEAEYYDGPTDHDGSGGGRPPAMKRARRPSIGDWESSGAGAGSGSGSGSGSGTAALAQGGAGGAGAGAK